MKIVRKLIIPIKIKVIDKIMSLLLDIPQYKIANITVNRNNALR